MTTPPAPLSRLCKLSALLLRYPEALLKREMPGVRNAVAQAGFPVAWRLQLDAVCSFLESAPLLDRQTGYISLFDLSPSLSLYLFQHVHGDSRERGQAMVDLLKDYEAAGLEIDGNELPDFLPVFLEYASTRSEEQIAALLGETVDILAVLEERLALRASPYSGIFAALRDASGQSADNEALRTHLEETFVLDDPATLDARYEEKPVTFMGSADAKERGAPPCRTGSCTPSGHSDGCAPETTKSALPETPLPEARPS